jgi:hypothetical protein
MPRRVGPKRSARGARSDEREAARVNRGKTRRFGQEAPHASRPVANPLVLKSRHAAPERARQREAAAERLRRQEEAARRAEEEAAEEARQAAEEAEQEAEEARRAAAARRHQRRRTALSRSRGPPPASGRRARRPPPSDASEESYSWSVSPLSSLHESEGEEEPEPGPLVARERVRARTRLEVQLGRLDDEIGKAARLADAASRRGDWAEASCWEQTRARLQQRRPGLLPTGRR